MSAPEADLFFVEAVPRKLSGCISNGAGGGGQQGGGEWGNGFVDWWIAGERRRSQGYSSVTWRSMRSRVVANQTMTRFGPIWATSVLIADFLQTRRLNSSELLTVN